MISSNVHLSLDHFRWAINITCEECPRCEKLFESPLMMFTPQYLNGSNWYLREETVGFCATYNRGKFCLLVLTNVFLSIEVHPKESRTL